MSKIIYLIEQPLDERNYARFGIQTWIDRGWDVEIWDLTPFLYPKVWRDFIGRGKKLKEFNGYFPIKALTELKVRYELCENAGYFIDFTGETYYSMRIKWRLIQKGVLRVICATGSMPEPHGGKQEIMIKKILKRFHVGPIKFFQWALNVALRNLMFQFIRPEIGVAAGSLSLHSLSHVNKIVQAHNLDYDIYLEIKDVIDTSASRQVVFLDQDYCFNSDFIYGGSSSPITSGKYFPAISKTLHKISEELQISMCIAAHPRSTYLQQNQDYFEGISIKYGVTAQLIRDCSVVLCHNSTAIQLAVLFEKPIIIVTTDELNNASEVRESIACFATALGKSIINIDGDLNKIDWQKELRVDCQKYAEYKKKYVKMNESLEKKSWDILINSIENNRQQYSPPDI